MKSKVGILAMLAGLVPLLVLAGSGELRAQQLYGEEVLNVGHRGATACWSSSPTRS